MTTPAPACATAVREPADWLASAAAHAARADALTAAHRERRAAGERHPIEDFLYDYYGTRPAQLRRWHPGAGTVLRPTADGPAEHAAWRWYSTDGDGAVTLDVGAFLADRGDTVRYLRELLVATASRRPFAGCFGLHEWAMVYRSGDARRRHDLPLRLGRAGTDAVVEAHPIQCSHFDAFRFFTPDAVGRNALTPTRQTQVVDEQPGCLHANMDLLKWTSKLGPAAPGGLLLDSFELARDIRVLDMQASPYDVSSLGEPAVAIETPAGRATYVARQRAFAERSAGLRSRLIDVVEDLGHYAWETAVSS
ncbi:3-methyladenine DNA glycosylase [Pengzhenrongella frigida]|uniref:3-methyladenine DNA glycosylase n=1 Tax=Pengzhenrongella frigida TaxID=1259133 RepID=A0A4Q5MVC7_9MICO|nr:3-methyladenine DNA glycosylase [Cellulomonas sp. HLT2-17]RYV49470.1 3-methyladenine DNA glycosylase [Cellulomonas sp. HLT2-17]